jgi:hypothetical protein
MTAQQVGQTHYDTQGMPAFVFGETKADPVSDYATFEAAGDKETGSG